MKSNETPRPPLRAVVVGVRGMGKSQAAILHNHPGYTLAGVCDLNETVARETAAPLGVPHWTDLAAMLGEVRPDVAAICTDNASHARLTIQSARAGVRGVYCEKPMATNLADARAMIAACRDAGAHLVINHQRRLGHDLAEARRIIESGALGDLLEIRAWNAGDFLSDGTHAVDSLLWLAGGQPALSVTGAVWCDPPDPKEIARGAKPGPGPGPRTRYGHAVESAAHAAVRLASGVVLEFHTGSLGARKPYQTYEIIGTRARLHRVGDRPPNLFAEDSAGAWIVNRPNQGAPGQPVPAESGRGALREIDLAQAPGPGAGRGAIADSYTRFAALLHEGTPHPMEAEHALRGFEIVMAVYESARLRRTVTLPLEQPRFPLDLMLEANTDASGNV